MSRDDFTADLDPDHPLSEFAPELANVFRKAGFTTDGVSNLLGANATNALYRGEPAAVRVALDWAEDDSSTTLPTIIRGFLLHDPVSLDDLQSALGRALVEQLVDAHVLTCPDEDDQVRVLVDIRPHVLGGADRWVFSDVDASLIQHAPGSGHVLGVGAASLSLLRTTPTTPVESVLDLGTGSGVQLLGQLPAATDLVGTDVHHRALDFARATVAAAHASDRIELLTGSWFEPVSGRSFDRVIANPPFVVGPPEISHVYRDSGLALDGATEKVVSEVADYLTTDGTAHLLGAWAHVSGENWRQRVASWLPGHGVAAWVMQRDVADPAQYVATWLKDESIDPRSPNGQEKTRQWLEYFADRKVESIGFGYIAVQRIDEDLPSDVLAEDMTQPFEGTLGPEIEEYFARAAWLRDLGPEEVLDHRYLVRPTTAYEEVSAPDDSTRQGFKSAVRRITRTDGPRWSHDIDEHLGSILAGLSPDGLALREIVELYAFAQGLETSDLASSAARAVVDLIRHGFLIPDELL